MGLVIGPENYGTARRGARSASFERRPTTNARQAIAQDSGFAAAYGLLSSYYFLSAFRGWRSPFVVVADSGMLFGGQALQRDSTLGQVWVIRELRAHREIP